MGPAFSTSSCTGIVKENTHEKSDSADLHSSIRTRRHGERATTARPADSPPRKAGRRDATDRRRQAVPGAGRRSRQHRFVQPRVHGHGLAEDCQGERQHRPGGCGMGLGRAGGRQVRLHARRWAAQGRAEAQPARHPAVVRKLEERPFELHAGVGEGRLQAFPARGPEERQTGGSALHVCAGQPGRRHESLHGLHASSEGSGRGAADGADDSVGERSGADRRLARPLRGGRGCLQRARAAGIARLPAEEQGGAVAGSTQAMG